MLLVCGSVRVSCGTFPIAVQTLRAVVDAGGQTGISDVENEDTDVGGSINKTLIEQHPRQLAGGLSTDYRQYRFSSERKERFKKKRTLSFRDEGRESFCFLFAFR